MCWRAIRSRPPASSARLSCWVSTSPTPHLAFGAILLYTAFHFIVFALIGMGLVALVHWGIENPVVRYALLPVFLVFEVLFYGFLEIVSEQTHDLFPFWAVVSANTLAAVCMAAYLWRRHPAFRRASMIRRSVRPPGDLVR